jgi:alkanesulfonate monooxygenase SsuD/methylene tetrahydromethanopterin reductase-like flavin-dependent oxidoreductase (luciferase family)
MPTGCFISTGRSLDDAIARVRLAESLGYHSVFVTHIAGRESLTVLTAYALATERIRVGRASSRSTRARPRRWPRQPRRSTSCQAGG